MFYYVYIIRSKNSNWNYVGFTKNPIIRLSQHNSGQVRSTKARRPYELLFVQCVDSGEEARAMENF